MLLENQGRRSLEKEGVFATKQRLVWQKGLRVKVWHLGGVREEEGSGSRFARSKVGPISREPLKSLSPSPLPRQGGAEEPVPVPGQAAPRVPGCGRPGGHLPAGPAEELRGKEGICQQLGRREEESPVFPDQATDGKREPCPHGAVASALLQDELAACICLSPPQRAWRGRFHTVLCRGGS